MRALQHDQISNRTECAHETNVHKYSGAKVERNVGGIGPKIWRKKFKLVNINNVLRYK